MTHQEQLVRLSRQIQAALRQGHQRRARGLVLRFLAQEGTDRTWGLSVLQSTLRSLRQEAEDPRVVEAIEQQERELQRQLIDETEGTRWWLHAWERARQLNGRAWEAYDGGASGAALKQALADVDESLAFWPYFLPHQDTRARILLRLGRTEEAHGIVRWVEAIQPGWPDFVDIVGSPPYQAWLEACDGPPRLPAGEATLAPVLPRIDGARRSRRSGRLGQAERALLREVRFGDDEWHRARNCALLAVALDPDLSLERMLETPPQRVDLSRGLMLESCCGSRPLCGETLERLRHWYLYGYTNHPACQGPAPSDKPGMRARIFVHWSLEPMTLAEVEALLAAIGRRVGIRGLSVARCEGGPGTGA